MELLRFDQPSLVNALDRLLPRFRVMFGATAAERLLPAYASFSRLTGRGDAVALTAVLDRLWQDLHGDRMNAGALQENLEVAMDLIPKENNGPWVAEQPAAENAATAVAYALRCRQSGQSQEAVWAAYQAVRGPGSCRHHCRKPDLNCGGAEEKVLAHPLVQAELSRQRRDLNELLAAKEEDVVHIATGLRARAQTDSETMFKNHD